MFFPDIVFLFILFSKGFNVASVILYSIMGIFVDLFYSNPIGLSVVQYNTIILMIMIFGRRSISNSKIAIFLLFAHLIAFFESLLILSWYGSQEYYQMRYCISFVISLILIFCARKNEIR